MEISLMRHSKAIAPRAANSTALRFSTGKAPGSPRQTGHTFVFGGSPKRVEHEQKIFDAVSSCTWTSSPMTGSYFARRSPETAGVVAIARDYKVDEPLAWGRTHSSVQAERSSAEATTTAILDWPSSAHSSTSPS